MVIGGAIIIILGELFISFYIPTEELDMCEEEASKQ